MNGPRSGRRPLLLIVYLAVSASFAGCGASPPIACDDDACTARALDSAPAAGVAPIVELLDCYAMYALFDVPVENARSAYPEHTEPRSFAPGTYVVGIELLSCQNARLERTLLGPGFYGFAFLGTQERQLNETADTATVQIDTWTSYPEVQKRWSQWDIEAIDATMDVVGTLGLTTESTFWRVHGDLVDFTLSLGGPTGETGGATFSVHRETRHPDFWVQSDLTSDAVSVILENGALKIDDSQSISGIFPEGAAPVTQGARRFYHVHSVSILPIGGDLDEN